MNEKARLVIKSQAGDEPIADRCPLCSRKFILPEDRRPKEAVTELWGAFREHVREEHPDHVELEM